MEGIDKYIKIAEKLGWVCFKKDCGDGLIELSFSRFSLAGHNFLMTIGFNSLQDKSLPDKIYEYLSKFDVDYEAIQWIDHSTGKGKNGAPDSIESIVTDFKRIENDIYELAYAMEHGLVDKRDKDRFKEVYQQATTELIDASLDESVESAVRFIKDYKLTDNYYGRCYILFGRKRMEVESIYVDDEDDHIIVHLDCEAFNDDVKLVNLSEDNIIRIMKFLRHEYNNKLKDKNYK